MTEGDACFMDLVLLCSCVITLLCYYVDMSPGCIDGGRCDRREGGASADPL